MSLCLSRGAQNQCAYLVPRNDFGMVFLSQTLSFTSKPELWPAMILAMRIMGVVNVSLVGSPENIQLNDTQAGQ